MGGGAGEHVPMSALARAHPMRDGMRHAPAAARCGVCLVAGARRRVVSSAQMLCPADARLLPCAAAAARAGRVQLLHAKDASAVRWSEARAVAVAVAAVRTAGPLGPDCQSHQYAEPAMETPKARRRPRLERE